jgi:hypothetical protein
VEALVGRKVIAVACGSFHMGCVTDSGELYTWGSSVWDQLGACCHTAAPTNSRPFLIEIVSSRLLSGQATAIERTWCSRDVSLRWWASGSWRYHVAPTTPPYEPKPVVCTLSAVDPLARSVPSPSLYRSLVLPSGLLRCWLILRGSWL